MNLLDCYVTKILDKPYKQYDVYWVPVEYNCEGRLSYTNVMCKDIWEAGLVKVGFKFQC